MLSFYIKFYVQNLYQIRKTSIKVRANIAIHADARKAARLIVNNWCNMIIDITNSNDETAINFTNVDLVEFRVITKTLLADNIQKTCC